MVSLFMKLLTILLLRVRKVQPDRIFTHAFLFRFLCLFSELSHEDSHVLFSRPLPFLHFMRALLRFWKGSGRGLCSMCLIATCGFFSGSSLYLAASSGFRSALWKVNIWSSVSTIFILLFKVLMDLSMRYKCSQSKELALGVLRTK